jgi:hypothetical protein
MKTLLTAWIIGLSLQALSGAYASELYSVSGTVTSVTDQAVQIKKNGKNGEIREFQLGNLDRPGGMNGVKVGDEITAWYVLSLKHVQINERGKTGRAGEQPGQKGEEPEIPPQHPLPGQIPGVKDDRGFYSS